MNISYDFSGRTVLVTGAAQGIGHSVASMFYQTGAKVAVVDRDQDALGRAWQADPDRILAVAVDVRDTAHTTEAIHRVAAWGESLDIVVNNAGVTRDTVVWKMTDDQWTTVIDVHLRGTFAVTRAAIPIMRSAGYGRIINVTSFTGMHGTIGQANYAAAKGGIIAFTKTVAKETAKFGITVNAISPNAATPMVTAVGEERVAAMTASVPMGRFGDPTEMATAVGYLAAEESSYLTGIVLPVDGGLSM
jgi:3-oxoacyl-[acyl-carrier protein] reductase